MLWLGEKTGMDALERALGRALQLLGETKLRNRLERMVKTSLPADLPPSPSNELHYAYGHSIFESVKHARATISGLLKVVERARQLDGRDDVAKRRDDLRAAAAPLRNYWTQVVGRAGKLTKWGDFSPTVKFIHDCLALIDPTVTHQLILDLDR
jgi:hypothetical protein